MKKLLITATVLFVMGTLLFVGALAFVGFDFMSLDTSKYETVIYEYSEAFENISIDIERADIVFASSNESICRVECFEDEKQKHSVGIQNGTLTISDINNRKWFDYIGFNFTKPQIKIYLPKSEYTSLTVKTQTGNIEITGGYSFERVTITGTTSDVLLYSPVSESIGINVTTGEISVNSTHTDRINLSATTGKITVNDVTCDTINTQSSTGRIYLSNVIAKEDITAKSTTGGVSFDRCDAWGIYVSASTGSVKGTLLSGKEFITGTSTGSVNVPKSLTGGRCEITTSTGNIDISIDK